MGSSFFCVMRTGMLAFVILLPVPGYAEPLPALNCSALPEHVAEHTVALYIVKPAETPGLVCAQIMNGLGQDLAVGGASLRLQKWAKTKWWRAGGFQDFTEPSPPGVMVGADLGLMMLPTGKSYTARLPRLGQPAPPGRYRVCFQSELVQADRVQATVCSAEFALP